MVSYDVTDVFTPTSPARLTFVERKGINKRIVRALKTKGTQIIVYGHSGSGKTTLIENKIFQLYENHVRTNCMKSMSFESILLNAFDQLDQYYTDEKTITKSSKIGINIGAEYLKIKSSLGYTSNKTSQEKEKRMLPPQLTAQTLAQLMGASNVCWILEDFHKLEESEKKKLSQLMKVFMDLSSDYKDLKIVFVGAVNTARQVIQYDKEMKLRVAEIHVPLMTNTEIEEIILKGIKLLNIEINDKSIIEEVYHYSNGLASICHKLCLLMCEERDIYETVDAYSSRDDLELNYDSIRYALTEYIEGLSDTIKCSFDKAFKIQDSRYIVEALSSCNKDGSNIDDIYDQVIGLQNKLGYNQVIDILRTLQTEDYGELIVFDTDSNKYSFSDPFLRSFALAFFDNRSAYKSAMSGPELMQLFETAFSSVKREYKKLDGNDILAIPDSPFEEEKE